MDTDTVAAGRSFGEARRLEALDSFDVLDTPRERDFDDIAALASAICAAPIAVVNLIGEGRQFFKAEVGLGVRETPLETSFCAKALLEEDFLLVPDATKDARFDCNPLVTGEPHLRFYAGALLKTEDGLPLGTVCVLDFQPRELSELQVTTLRVLARQAMKQLELRRSLKLQRELNARHRAIVESATDYAIIVTDLAGRVTDWNEGARRILGWTAEEMRGRPAHVFFTDDDNRDGVPAQEISSALLHGRGLDERWHVRKDGTLFWASGEMMPLRGDDDQVGGFLKILRDRTDERLRAQQVVASEARLRLAQEAGRVGTFDLELSTEILSVTPAFCRLFGLPEAPSYPAATAQALILREDRGVASDDGRRQSGSASLDVEYRIRRADDGQVRWIARRAEFLRDAAGRVVTMAGTVQDVTAARASAVRSHALLELGDRLREASTTGEVAGIAAEILGRTLEVDRAGFATIDQSRDTLTVERDWTVEGVASLAGRSELSGFRASAARLAAGETLAVPGERSAAWLAEDAESYAAIGTRAYLKVPLVARGDLLGALFAHAAAARDWSAEEVDFARGVADRAYAALAKVRAENEQRILNQELSHRLKNTLAMVQAIATQTLKRVGERDAVEAFEKRILALSKAHDVLLQESWSAARIRTVAEGVLALVGERTRFSVEGPNLLLGPKATLSLSLLLNELGTNAVKYGALSVEAGRVDLRWSVAPGSEPDFVLTWEERHGPAVSEPTTNGFGSRLIRMGLVGTGQVSTGYVTAGFRAEIRAPLSVLQQG